MQRWLSIIIAIAIPGIIIAGEADLGRAVYQPYPEAPGFTVQPPGKKRQIEDCARCHADRVTDPEPRRLISPHVYEMDHGGARFWCLTCHNAENRDFLLTSRNDKIDFDQSHIICGSCHADRQKDWYFGGHGKRVSGWQEERVILACTECHDPHKPAMKPRQPKPRPPVRIGLERQEHHPPAASQVWNR